MVAAVPSLGLSGWITDPEKMLDQLLADFVVAEYTQSELFYGNVGSLPWLVQQYGKNPDELANAVQRQLEKNFGPYFQLPEFTVTHQPLAGESDANTRYQLTILITGVISGIKVNLAQNFSVRETTFSKLVEIANG